MLCTAAWNASAGGVVAKVSLLTVSRTASNAAAFACDLSSAEAPMIEIERRAWSESDRTNSSCSARFVSNSASKCCTSGEARGEREDGNCAALQVERRAFGVKNNRHRKSGERCSAIVLAALLGKRQDTSLCSPRMEYCSQAVVGNFFDVFNES